MLQSEQNTLTFDSNDGNAGVFVSRGPGGWGTGLHLRVEGRRNRIVSVTGGGIHPVARKIAEYLNCPVVDAFLDKVEIEEMVCAVVDCGGTARMGVYPMKRIPTVNVKPASPSGPLASHITEDIFVSGVTLHEISFIKPLDTVNITNEPIVSHASSLPSDAASLSANQSIEVKEQSKLSATLIYFAKSAAYIMGWIYQSGKDAVSSFTSHVLPMILGISVIIGAVRMFQLDPLLTAVIQYSLGSLPGLMLVAFIFSIPVISNYIGAGATLGQVLVALLGYEIAMGQIDMIWLLPALFATNVQVGCDFLPTGLMMSNCEQSTVKAGLKAVLYSRFITSIFSVLIAYFVSLQILS
jgi:PTS system glucitol/sorbitol-specific IIB component